jgi:hypothetical protein
LKSVLVLHAVHTVHRHLESPDITVNDHLRGNETVTRGFLSFKVFICCTAVGKRVACFVPRSPSACCADF